MNLVLLHRSHIHDSHLVCAYMLCVWAWVYACSHICVSSCSCMWSGEVEVTSDAFLYCAPLYLLRRGLFWTWSSPILSSLANQYACESCIHVGSGELNSDPHICTIIHWTTSLAWKCIDLYIFAWLINQFWVATGLRWLGYFIILVDFLGWCTELVLIAEAVTTERREERLLEGFGLFS